MKTFSLLTLSSLPSLMIKMKLNSSLIHAPLQMHNEEKHKFYFKYFLQNSFYFQHNFCDFLMKKKRTYKKTLKN